jgi:hypothetical protein
MKNATALAAALIAFRTRRQEGFPRARSMELLK